MSTWRSPRGLWDSYEDDAFPRDKDAGVFFDPSRQHTLNHRGEHFSVVGRLNLQRSPQGQPVVFQAGDSEDGRDLGAAVGEGIFTMARSFEAARAFYREMKERAAAKGRDPDSVLIFPGLSITLADTDAEARRLEDEVHAALDFAEFGRPFGWHDFSQYDLDAPFPDVSAVAERSFRTQAEASRALRASRAPRCATPSCTSTAWPARVSPARRGPSPTRSSAGSPAPPRTASSST